MIDSFFNVEGIITQIGDSIKRFFDNTVGHWISLDWIPEIVFWYWWLFVLFIVLSIILKFFGWISFVRIGASILLATGAVFVAGGHWFKHRSELAAAKKAARLRRR